MKCFLSSSRRRGPIFNLIQLLGLKWVPAFAGMIVFLITMLLTSCGQSGKLYLPDIQHQQEQNA